MVNGYAIMAEVEVATEGKIRLGPGTLYGTIKRLLESKLIEESDERPDPAMDDERRRYYRLTKLGAALAEAEAERMERVLAIARAKHVLRPESA